MTADRTTREQLAAALFRAGASNYELALDRYLLPVVDRIADQRAAAELRAAADGWTKALPGLAEQLRDRADALDPQQRDAP